MTCLLKGEGFRLALPVRAAVLFMIGLLFVAVACDKSSTETMENLSMIASRVMKSKPRPVMVGSPTPARYKPPPPWPERVRKINRKNIPGVENIHENYLDLAAGDDRWRQQIEMYRAVIPLGTGEMRTAVDVGSGTGSFSVAAEKLGMAVLNADTVTEGQPYLHVVAERGLLGIIHDARHPLPLVDRAMDLVHCNNVFSLVRTERDSLHPRRVGPCAPAKGYVILSFHHISMDDPEAKAYRARVAAVEETVLKLKWKTLKMDKWTPQPPNEETVCYYFQKPIAGEAAYSLLWEHQR